MKEFADYVQDVAHDEPDLARLVSDWSGLNAVLNWMETGPKRSIDLIGQDEFEYDFLIQMDDARWLVFGVT